MWPALLAGAGLGLVKNLEGQRLAGEERKRQAAMTRYSPWTGMQGHSVQDPSLVGDLSTGAAIGAMGMKMFPASGAAPTGELVASPEAMSSMAAQPDSSPYSLYGAKKPSWLSLASQQPMQKPY